MTLIYIMVKSILQVKCTVLEVCYSVMAFVIRECSTKVLEMAQVLPLIQLVINTKENTVKVYEKVKAFLRLTAVKYIRVDGITIECMVVEEKLLKTESVILYIIRMVINLKLQQANLKILCLAAKELKVVNGQEGKELIKMKVLF